MENIVKMIKIKGEINSITGGFLLIKAGKLLAAIGEYFKLGSDIAAAATSGVALFISCDNVSIHTYPHFAHLTFLPFTPIEESGTTYFVLHFLQFIIIKY